MGTRVLQLALPVSLLLCFSAASRAQPGTSWEYLGDSHVDGSQDHDNIKITASSGTFKAIRVKVEDAAIEFDRVVVHFGNGNAVPITIRSKVRPGQETRAIDIPGRERIIESVEVWYRRGNPDNPEKPHLLLYGRS